MKINVSQLKRNLGSSEQFSFTTTAAHFSADESIWIDGEVGIRGEIVNNGRSLQLQGVITISATVQCDRCLEVFSHTEELPFGESFLEADVLDDVGGETEDVSYYQGDELDITAVVRDAIVLAEPIQKLCREDCQGLCPICGADKNHTRCSCEQTGMDSRFAALKTWLDKPSE